jgi:hypothetical protein
VLLTLSGSLPITGVGRHPIIRSPIAEFDEIGMQLPDRALLLAQLTRLDAQHRREFVGVRIELARTLQGFEAGLDAVRAQIFANCIS